MILFVPLRLEHLEGVNNTPAARLVTAGLLELMDLGHVNELTNNWDHRAIVAWRGSEPVGVLTYDRQDYRKVWWVQMAYVVAAHRRTGVYRALWEELVRRAQAEEKARPVKVQGGIGVRNAQMMRTAEALGRRPAWTVYDFDVPPRPSESGEDRGGAE